MSVWGFRAFALLPLLSLLGLVTGVGLVIAGKWLFVGRYREGEHPIWGWFFIRHWLSNQFIVVSVVVAGGVVWLASRVVSIQAAVIFLVLLSKLVMGATNFDNNTKKPTCAVLCRAVPCCVPYFCPMLTYF